MSYFIPQPVFQEIMQSGKLDILSDVNLKGKLYEWQDEMNWLAIDNNKFQNWNENHLQPFLIKKISYKNWDVVSGSTLVSKRSILTNDYDSIFESLEFENLIDNNVFGIQKIYTKYQKVIKIIDEIIELTQSENSEPRNVK